MGEGCARACMRVWVWVWVCTMMINQKKPKKSKKYLELSFFRLIFAPAKHENNGQNRQANTTNKYS